MGLKARTYPRGPVVFETQRLTVRHWRLVDAEAAFALYGDPLVVKYIGGRLVTSVSGQREFLKQLKARYMDCQQFGGWALWEKQTDTIVGAVLIKPLPDRDNIPTQVIEIGWHIRRDRWGEGFATEAGQGVRHYAFGRLGLGRVVAVIEPPNTASLSVARRLGMKSLGTSRAYYGGICLEVFESLAPAS